MELINRGEPVAENQSPRTYHYSTRCKKLLPFLSPLTLIGMMEKIGMKDW